jgi:glycosyltransferase involved in cell wall biosynthesis
MIPEPARAVVRSALSLCTRHWADHSRLILVPDIGTWVIRWEMRELAQIARRLGIRLASPRWVSWSRNQAVFFGSQFFLLSDDWLKRPHRIATAYFHGKPGTGFPDFDRLYEHLRRHHDRIARVQVSHSEMHDILLGTGIAPEKVFRIPIGINLSWFRAQTAESRKSARAKLGLPASAAVVGSFHKDGSGWGEGMEPKPIKGPDVLLRTLELLKPRVKNLWVLLSGPARGYVKAGLERLGIPYRHVVVRRYPDVGELYQAIDAYVVASRQEGGPKAVLEAMASGVPLVTTRVGQAMDLVRHGANGWLVPVEDAEGLAHWTGMALDRARDAEPVVLEGLRTAEANSYTRQVPLWRSFMDGFVEAGGRAET